MSELLDLPHVPTAAVPAQASPPARPVLRVVPPAPELDFDAVVSRLTPRLRRYAERRLGDRHEAEELVQEALLRAYDHRHELATEDDVAAWSTCVTGRLVVDRLRVRGRSTSVAEVPEGSRVGRDTADVVVAREQARLALDALDAMPSRQASVLWAREVEGLSYDAIGERFGMTEPTVRSLLSRARKALRAEFEARGGSLPAGGLVALAPWVQPLGWADRLRDAVGRLVTPAIAGSGAVGVLGTALLVLPHGGPVEVDVAPRPAVVVAAAQEARPLDVPTRVVRPVAAPVDVTSTVPVLPAQPAPADPPGPLPFDDLVVDSGVNDTCTPDSFLGEAPLGVGVGGGGCAPSGSSRIGFQELPDTPLGANGVSVEVPWVTCDDLRAAPVLTCESPEGASK